MVGQRATKLADIPARGTLGYGLAERTALIDINGRTAHPEMLSYAFVQCLKTRGTHWC